MYGHVEDQELVWRTAAVQSALGLKARFFILTAKGTEGKLLWETFEDGVEVAADHSILGAK